MEEEEEENNPQFSVDQNALFFSRVFVVMYHKNEVLRVYVRSSFVYELS